MVEKLPEAIPELQDLYAKEVTEPGDKDSPYNAYAFVLYPHIRRLLKAESEDERQLRKVFDFLELILTHPDGRVRDVADQDVCEAIACDEIVLQKAQRYMGPAAKKSCADYIEHGPKK